MQERHVLVLLLFAISVICYADRTNISVAILSISAEQNWTEEQTGFVLSAFFMGYMCTQVLGGVCCRKYGGVNVLSVGVIGWSVATLLTPLAIAWSFPMLILIRIVLGLFEGVAMPSIHHLIGCWSLPAERSRFISLITAGQFIGTVAAMACAPVVAWHWQLVFYLFGGLGNPISNDSHQTTRSTT